MKYYRSDLGTVTDGHARPAYAHLTVNFQPDSASFFLSNDAAVVCLCNKGDLQMLNEETTSHDINSHHKVVERVKTTNNAPPVRIHSGLCRPQSA